MRLSLALAFLLLVVSVGHGFDPGPPFEIREGDRVLLLGDALLERENTYGYLETRMHEQFPDRRFTVRNLSWAGDTPKGWSRASFDAPEQGWDRLKEQIAIVQPTVVFLGYGMAASLQELTDRSGDITLNPDPARYGREPMSATRFKQELGELMDAILELDRKSAAGGTPGGVRFVLLSPIRHEDLRAVRPGLPDPAEHNRLLEQYSRSLDELAVERGSRLVSLQGWIARMHIASSASKTGREFASAPNGIHLSESGYDEWSEIVSRTLVWSNAPPKSERAESSAEKIAAISELIRAAVIRKNELVFQRFRPANSTYLTGFRKHEQGQNAREITAFDPLIEAADAEIERLKQTVAAAPGSTRVPRVGSGVSPERTSDSATAAGESVASAPLQEVRDGGTPPPARGTRALPGASATGDTPLPRPAFTVEDGYQIELWAENPLLGKPTQMNWDAQGRLWVCSSSLYPQVAPGEAVNDKILILTDTDRDGRADKSEVFAEGLLIPTGVVPDLVRAAEGGQRTEDSREKTAPTPSPPVTSDLRPPSSSPAACYVAQSSELLHFTDTDGDGKADQRRVIFSGFGTEDTHHLIHTLRWGPDGRLYFNQSVYIHSHVETAWGMLRLNSGGVFAYDPRTERLEVFAKGLWNPWGHAWDDWGQSFLTDGAGSTGISWAFPGATFAPFEGSRRQMPSISPGSYPKFCGLELIKSPHFPADWQGNAITCDFRAHRIVRFRIEDLSVEKETATTQSPRRPEEISEPTSSASSAIAPVAPSRFQPRSGYTTKEMPDLVRTDDVNFRPIDVRLGPDGALYVADWSNPIIQHGEVDFRDPRRNKHAGRIWRISRKGAKAQSWEPLLGRTTDELLEKLLSESAWEKEQARLTLVAAINAAAPEGGITPPPSQIKRITAFMEAKTTSSFSLETVNLFAALPSSGPANWDGFKFLAAVQFAQNAKTVSNRAIGVRAAGLLLSKAIAADGAEHARQWALFGQGVNDFAEKRPLSIPADSLAARVLTKKEPMESLTEHNSLWLTSPVFNFASDPSPRVRLEAMRALSRIQTARSAELVLEAAVTQAPSLNVQQASSPQTLAGRADNQAGSLSYDRHFDFAAWQSINDLAKPWTDAIASGEWKIEGREAQLAWGLKAIDPVLAGATLSKLFAAEKVPLDGTGPWFEIIGAVGGPAELQPLWDSLLASYAGNCCDTDEVHALSGKVPHLYEPAARRALAAILEAARTRNVRPAERTHLATQLFHSFDALQLAAVELAARWQSPDAVAKLRELLDEAEVAVPLRRAAFQALGTLATPEAIATLKEWKKPETPALDRREGFLALAQHRFSDVAAELPRILQEVPSEAEALEVWRRLVQIKGAVELIANAVSPEMNAQLPKHVITAGIQAAREAGKSGSKLAEVLRPLPAPGLMETPASRSSLAARAQASGDPAAGELIYQRSALSCVMCHAIGGVGGNLGPDLTSLGASAPLNYIVESLIDPAAKVKEGYHAVALNLKDGTQASGIQARETPEEVILRNPAGGEQPVAKAQISSRTDLGSIMPAGLIDALPEKEQLDLVAFLGQLGKPGRFDASKGHVARIWRLHSGSDSAKVLRGPAGELPGIAAYTLIDGRLLKGALEESAELVPGSSATLLAVTQFDGNAQTSVQLTGATRAWLDGDLFWENGQAVTGKTPNAEGLHTLTVELPRSGFPEFLRAEVAGGRFLNR